MTIKPDRSELTNLNLSLLNAFTRKDGATRADVTNVVDGLFAIAAAINRLADLVEKVDGKTSSPVPDMVNDSYSAVYGPLKRDKP